MDDWYTPKTVWPLTLTISKGQNGDESGFHERFSSLRLQRMGHTHKTAPGYAHNAYEISVKYVNTNLVSMIATLQRSWYGIKVMLLPLEMLIMPRKSIKYVCLG